MSDSESMTTAEVTPVTEARESRRPVPLEQLSTPSLRSRMFRAWYEADSEHLTELARVRKLAFAERAWGELVRRGEIAFRCEEVDW